MIKVPCFLSIVGLDSKEFSSFPVFHVNQSNAPLDFVDLCKGKLTEGAYDCVDGKEMGTIHFPWICFLQKVCT